MAAPKNNSFSAYHSSDYVYQEKRLILPHHVLLESLKRVYESAIDHLKLPKFFTPELFTGATVSSLISAFIAISDSEKPAMVAAKPHLIAAGGCAAIAIGIYIFKLIDLNTFKSDHKQRDRCVKRELDSLYKQSSRSSDNCK